MRITALVLALLLLGASYYAAGKQRVLNAQNKVIASQEAIIKTQNEVIASYGNASGLLREAQDKCADSLLELAKAFELDTKPSEKQ